MLAEHSFITTAEAEPALRAADELLCALGFVREPGPAERVYEYRRGLARAARAKKVSDLPQRVRLEYDRGRVTLAAAVEEQRKGGDLHRARLLALADVVEAVVGRGRSLPEARLPWDAVDERIEAQAAAQRRRVRVLIVVLLVIVFGLIGLIVWAVAASA